MFKKIILLVLISSSLLAKANLPEPPSFNAHSLDSTSQGEKDFGESISPLNGAISWYHTDLAYEGTGIPITISRSFEMSKSGFREFGSFELDYPKIILSTDKNGLLKGQSKRNEWTKAICKNPLPKTGETDWSGLIFKNKGSSKRFIRKNASNTSYPNSTDFLTKDNWLLTCLDGSNEKVIIRSPGGYKYYFDKLDYAYGDLLTNGGGTGLLTILPSRVVDPQGNSLTYNFDEYEPVNPLISRGELLQHWSIKSIETSDERKAVFNWGETQFGNKFIKSIDVHGVEGGLRSINYSYGKMAVNTENSSYCSWWVPLNYDDGRVENCQKRTQLFDSVYLVGVDIENTDIEGDWEYFYNGPAVSTLYDGIHLAASFSMISKIVNPSKTTAEYSYKSTRKNIFDESEFDHLINESPSLANRKYTTPRGYGSSFSHNYSKGITKQDHAITTVSGWVDGDLYNKQYLHSRRNDYSNGFLESESKPKIANGYLSDLITLEILYNQDKPGAIFDHYLMTQTHKDLDATYATPFDPIGSKTKLNVYSRPVVDTISYGLKTFKKDIQYDTYGAIRSYKKRLVTYTDTQYKTIKHEYFSNYSAYIDESEPYNENVSLFNGLLEKKLVNDKLIEEIKYYPDGQVKEEIRFGDYTLFTYSPTGNIKEIKRKLPKSAGYHTTTLAGYKLGNPQYTYSNGKLVETNLFDEWGNRTRHIDGENNQIDYVYDLIGRLKRVEYNTNDGNGYYNEDIYYEWSVPWNAFITTKIRGHFKDVSFADGSGNRVFLKYKYNSKKRTGFYQNFKFDQLGRVIIKGKEMEMVESRFSSSMPQERTQFKYTLSGELASQLIYSSDSALDPKEIRIDHKYSMRHYNFSQAEYEITESVFLPDGNGYRSFYRAGDAYSDRRLTYKNIFKGNVRKFMLVYKYDDLDRIKSISRSETEGSEILDTVEYKYAYDSVHLEKISEINHPNGVDKVRVYDPDSGHLVSEQVGSSITSYTYNDEGLLEKTVAPAYTGNYEYDGNGRLNKSYNDQITYEYSYLYNGNPRYIHSNLYGNVLTYDVNADFYGSNNTVTFPSGKTYTYEIDYIHNKEVKLEGIVNNVSLNPNGSMDSISYSNGATQVYQYNDWSLLESELLTTNDTSIGYSYVYDALNRLTNATSSPANKADESYKYDVLSRLKKATGAWGDYEYSFDVADRLKSITSSSGTKSSVLEPGTTKVSSTIDGEKLIYDTEGNVTNIGSKSFKFSGQKLVKDDLGSAYMYDPNGQLAFKSSGLDGEFFMRDLAGNIISTFSPIYSLHEEYVRLNGKVIHKRKSTTLDSDSDGIVDYVEDQIGFDKRINDKLIDNDADGLTNYQEYILGSNSNLLDSDGDDMSDYYEFTYSLKINENDALQDNDGDGLSNILEYNKGSNPNLIDTDYDGQLDYSDSSVRVHNALIPSLQVLL